MLSRRRSRERAVQILYQCDVRNLDVEEAIAATYDLLTQEGEQDVERDGFTEELVHGTLKRMQDIDSRIAQFSEHWRIERMPAVDRNILRMAVYEMLETGTPPAVVIDEAVDLARRFSGRESAPFVNGVLDSVRKQIQSA